MKNRKIKKIMETIDYWAEEFMADKLVRPNYYSLTCINDLKEMITNILKENEK